MSLLGIDVGTTGCKAIAYSLEGVPLARAFAEYGVQTGPESTLELDSVEVWQALRAVIAQVAASTHQDPIEALSATSMSELVVPLSRNGGILGNGILPSDPRGGEYAEQIAEALGRQRLYDLTGNVPGSSYTMAKLCWMRDHAVALYRDAWRFVPWASLVLVLLGGRSACDYSLASRTLLLDLRKKRWSRELLQLCELSEDKLPELAPAGTPVGTISAAAAEELGLPPKVQLILGGHDLCCGALGAGAIQPTAAAYALGTSLSLLGVFEAIPLSSLLMEQGLNMEPHVVPGLLVTFLYSPSGGAILIWYRDQLAPLEKAEARRRGYNVLERLLEEMPAKPTALMVLPHFGGAGVSPSGEHPSGVVAGLTIHTTRGELIKGLLEGMTYQMADGYELLQNAGVSLESCRATGGGAHSAAWLQLTADVLGLTIERPAVSEATTLGAALLAGIGAGRYRDAEEAAHAAIRIESRFEPNPEHHAVYRRRVGQYREFRNRVVGYLSDLKESV